MNAFVIIGGEPLLHPELDRIITFVANREKIRRVVVTTNGTLLPREEDWEALRHEKVFVRISNYGDLSSRKDELIAALEERGIQGELLPAGGSWYKNPWCYSGNEPKPAPEQSRAAFAACAWNSCFAVESGRFFRCGIHVNGVRLGLLPEIPGDILTLSGPAGRASRSAARDFIHYATSCEACGYCRLPSYQSGKVPAAIQV